METLRTDTASGAGLRVREVLHGVGLPARDLQRAPAATNEVWLAGDVVVRIGRRQGRLAHEARVAALLPADVRYPAVVAHGEAGFGEWMVLERRPGTPLARAWAGMSVAERRRAIDQLAEALGALHGLRPSATELATLAAPFHHDLLAAPEPEGLAAVLACTRRARHLPFVDVSVIEAAQARAREWAPHLEGPPHQGLVHGDLHLENVLWDNGVVTAVLDVEFARPAPPDLDLDVLSRFCRDPMLHVAEDYAGLARRDDYRPVVGWLRDAYPALFAHPHLEERLAFYALAFDLRALLLDPPRGPADVVAPHHPVARLRRAVDARSTPTLVGW